MRLEMASFPVKEVRLSKRTYYSDGVLEVSKEELLGIVLEEKRIESADLDVVFPGEQTRIVHVRDVVEPRFKVSGPGCVFPGILGPVETVGEGKTHRLSGVTVIATAQYRPTVTTGTGAGTSGVVDMWGPGSQLTPFGSLINITLILKLIDGVTEEEAHAAIQLAECKVAHRLAETTKGRPPENVEVFELLKVDPSLPRVAYNICAYTEVHVPIDRVIFYGLPIRESLPTFVHPNEFLDGAVTSDARKGLSFVITTWEWQNNPVILGLLREHGKRLNCVGVILQRTRFESEFGKHVTAACTSQMARLLGVEGAIFTRMSGSGNQLMDVMWTVQAYEKKGIKTVLLTAEQGGGENEVPLPFYVPEATAMVSTGDLAIDRELSEPSKVIGCEKGQFVVPKPKDPPFSPWSKLTLDRWGITGGADWHGFKNHTCKEY